MSVVIYRLTLHPLAKYPGPFLAKITDWSIVVKARRGDRHLDSWAEHEAYGPVVRIGPNTLSFNTSSALASINSSRSANVQKGPWYRTIDAGSKAFSVHSEIDRVRHAFRRRILDQAFSDSALNQAEEIILSNVRSWTTELCSTTESKGWSPPRNLKNWSDWLAFDMMGDLTFSKSFGAVSEGRNRFVPAVVLESTKFVYEAGFWPFISLIRPFFGTRFMSWVMSFFLATRAADNESYIKYANAQMMERMAAEASATTDKPQRRDLVHYLLHARDPSTGAGLTHDELNADAALLIHAGSDTVACTIASTLFYLLHHPRVLGELQRELRGSFPTLASIHTSAKLNAGFPLLRACIDESLRMAPPVPSHLPRQVLPGGIMIDGHFIPAGTIVGVGAFAIHHDETYFPEPFEWRPERWIVETVEDKDKEEQVKVARGAFYAFGVGPRMCAGRKLAYLEISLALAVLLWSCEIRLAQEVGTKGLKVEQGRDGRRKQIRSREDVYQIWDHFVADRNGPVVQFKLRDEAAI
ncbi:uncharacterized protein HMPREF1541_01916 [Cyphellophora europaea CBS 101466]|uniref:Benzoate 4-monooxygenase cytochrome P450 n=1 Tax=Cyphellophora europaea (strain CBS 101466) TaxID=1220924 RepID=W2S3X9_CYPE1|nr:uncharacterized protein HMPREF1541_01916 [Cyphellophora europaea CBS 101466]ETN42758.1 hypothetical protein HMPREF1541_01916 [Cyphellophora europaea CBS 101466]